MRKRAWQVWAMGAAVAVTVAAGGCGTSTYVNIPSLSGNRAADNPNLKTTRSVMGAALAHSVRRYPVDGPYGIVLPTGADEETYGTVLGLLGQGASRGDDAGLIPAYEIARVRVRGWNGQVDVIAPGGIEGRQLVSVFVSVDKDGWYATHSRAWRVSVERALELSGEGL